MNYHTFYDEMIIAKKGFGSEFCASWISSDGNVRNVNISYKNSGMGNDIALFERNNKLYGVTRGYFSYDIWLFEEGSSPLCVNDASRICPTIYSTRNRYVWCGDIVYLQFSDYKIIKIHFDGILHNLSVHSGIVNVKPDEFGIMEYGLIVNSFASAGYVLSRWGTRVLVIAGYELMINCILSHTNLWSRHIDSINSAFFVSESVIQIVADNHTRRCLINVADGSEYVLSL